MFTDPVSIKLLGIHETEISLPDLRAKINILFKEAPYSSTVKATFGRRGYTIKGVITIYTSKKRFFAKASGQNLNEVVNKLTDLIRKQFDPYKKRKIKMDKNWYSLFNFNKSKKVRDYDFNIFSWIV